MSSAAGVYIHIPFCAKKCPYCDFYSERFDSALKGEYLRALECSIKTVSGCPRADTVYFGGGTPSLLSGDDFRRLICAARQGFELFPESEITAELNPADCEEPLLCSLLSAGINRASIGIQSLSDRNLKLLGRRHSAKQAEAAIRAARAAGFKNISADLMIALPGQTPDSAAEDAADIAALGPDHISAYILKLAEGTAFYQNPPADLPGEDCAADIYLAVCSRLEALGYRHYEISNFAKPGFEGRHNLKYWRCADYYGFGPSAAGCVGNRRYRYGDSIADFISGVPPEDEGAVGSTDFIVCSLRTREGLSLGELYRRFGFRFGEQQTRFIEKLVTEGYMIREGGVLRLTDRGFLVSNSILAGMI